MSALFEWKKKESVSLRKFLHGFPRSRRNRMEVILGTWGSSSDPGDNTCHALNTYYVSEAGSPFLLTVTVSPEEPKVQSVCLSHSVENGKCQESVWKPVWFKARVLSLCPTSPPVMPGMTWCWLCPTMASPGAAGDTRRQWTQTQREGTRFSGVYCEGVWAPVCWVGPLLLMYLSPQRRSGRWSAFRSRATQARLSLLLHSEGYYGYSPS